MPIDTEIKGSPESILGAAEWIGSTLRPGIEAGVDAFADARNEAGGDWRGDTGAAFEGAMGRAVRETESLRRAAGTVRSTFVDYAGSLDTCQDRMATIRSDARGAGLTVSGFVIEEPGPGPARPGDPPVDASQGQVDAYDRSVAAYNEHQDLVLVSNGLVERANDVLTDIERAWERVSAENRAMDGPGWAFQLTDVAGGLGGALMQVHVSALRGNARYFANLSADYLERLRTSPVTNAAQFYDDLGHWTRTGAGAADDAARAARLANIGRFAPVALGGALAIGGIFYDMHGPNQEGLGQAATSNLGGFAASVGTGALIGTAIGGPVGTVVGTVVGAGVGVFTSGMIDGLWENGGDVGDAFMAGVDSVVDTGEALADVGGAIVDGIGGLFD